MPRKIPTINKNFKADEQIIGPAVGFLINNMRSYTTTSFFKPYKGLKDVAQTVASPIYAPFAWGALSVGAALVTAASVFATLGYLGMSGFSYAAGRKEAASDYLSITTQVAIVTGFTAVLTPLLAIMAVISMPENLAKIVSRGIKTAIDATSKKEENLGVGYI
jgi:hypothetical protein